ncbi:hypothetical protein [Pseudomonas huaxiensis]|uniref:hypothetical protein n=1 Tax=Pseudomonas huaxiensis TaxID=2213017 RepID=UPI000DA6D9D6|nr:hypothetical protein [Pseudomonas huaxiensis]
MLNSVQKSVLVTGITTVALMAAQTAFAADGLGGVLEGFGGLLDEVFNVAGEVVRRLGGR